MELLPSLLEELKAVCGTFPDTRQGRGGNIAMADFGLSAFSLFFMQSESFLSHQRALEKGHSRTNCQTLFGMEYTPTDNYIRPLHQVGRAPAAPLTRAGVTRFAARCGRHRTSIGFADIPFG